MPDYKNEYEKPFKMRSVFRTYATKKMSQFKEREEFDSNGFWMPIIFSVLTFVYWLIVVLFVKFQAHAFDSSQDICYRNYR